MTVIISVPSEARKALDKKINELKISKIQHSENGSVITVELSLLSKQLPVRKKLLDFQNEVWLSWKEGKL